MKNYIYVSCIIVLISLVPISSFGLANTAWIPPTNAFDKIHGDIGTILAMNYSMPLIIKGGTGITVTATNSTHTITITNTGASSTNQGTYNKTLADNTLINSLGNRINFKNGTNNPVNVVDDPTRNQVNITISSLSGSGSVTGSQNIGHGTGSQGVLSTATATTIRGKNVTAGTGITVSGNTTDITITNSQTQGITSLNFTTNNDFDFHSGNRNVTYTTLDGQVFNLHIKPNIVLTNESAQIIFKALTLNQGILGGNLNVAGFGLSNSGHVSSLPLNTGELLQKNGTGAYLTENVHKIIATSPLSANGSTNTVNISCPTCGTLSSAITSINSQTGPAVNIVGSTGNITITNSTNQLKINTGDDIPHLSKFNNFTASQALQDVLPQIYLNNTSDVGSGTTISQIRYLSLNTAAQSKTFASFQTVVQNDLAGSESGLWRVFAMKKGSFLEWLRIDPTDLLSYDGAIVRISSGARLLLTNATTNTAITDPTAHAGWFWLSSTTPNTYKYTSASNIYAVQPQYRYNFTSPGNVTGTTSAALVMSGSYVTLTPLYSTNATITATGYVYNSVATDGCKIQVRQSTSNMGANGAALAGTQKGSTVLIVSPTAQANQTLSKTVVTSNLVAGTKYFFDLSFARTAGGYCKIQNLDWYVSER